VEVSSDAELVSEGMLYVMDVNVGERESDGSCLSVSIPLDQGNFVSLTYPH
jgi:hypothetical protein